MMKVLIIYAHPGTPGHCPLILREVESVLKEKKMDFKTLDLYKMHYDPILHENEHYTSGNKELSEETKAIQQDIMESDHLIFIYPVWWYSMPAMLKGFLDKVLTPRFAYVYEGYIPKGLLKGKKATIFFTTGGPRLYYLFIGNPTKKIMSMTLSFMGIKSRFIHIGNARKLTLEREALITRKVRRALVL
jgi:NAD(P)H dehydrogenase (quinone)